MEVFRRLCVDSELLLEKAQRLGTLPSPQSRNAFNKVLDHSFQGIWMQDLGSHSYIQLP